MKALIFIYTNTKNTLFACQYLSKQISECEWDFYDIKKNKDHKISEINFNNYDLFGFACYTDAWDVPKFMKDFINKLPIMKDKHAFVFNTFGATSGKTLINLAKRVKEKGLNVINGFSLHCPENYPPMIAMGMGNASAPSLKEKNNFFKFIEKLRKNIILIKQHQELKIQKINIGLWKYSPQYPHSLIDLLMGRKKVDQKKCKKCGLCCRSCPVNAIKLDPYPVFDDQICLKCWACYNLCPQQAIYTTTFKKARYPKPNKEFQEKF